MSSEPTSMDRPNRVKVGFLSATHSSPTGDDQPYLSWHRLDHMPEQYRLPGLVLGQRWKSSPECRRARWAEAETWKAVEHIVCYFMGEPVDETVDDFLALGRQLAEMGRYSQVMPSQYRGALRLLGTAAAPRVLVSPEVVPFRPHGGIFIVIEEPDGPSPVDAGAGAGARWDGHLQRLRDEIPGALTQQEGVAGVWTFATSPDLRRRMFTGGTLAATLCYLDNDPAAVAQRLAPALERLFAQTPTRVLLAAPFESIIRWEGEDPAPST